MLLIILSILPFLISFLSLFHLGSFRGDYCILRHPGNCCSFSRHHDNCEEVPDFSYTVGFDMFNDEILDHISLFGRSFTASLLFSLDSPLGARIRFDQRDAASSAGQRLELRW